MTKKVRLQSSLDQRCTCPRGDIPLRSRLPIHLGEDAQRPKDAGDQAEYVGERQLLRQRLERELLRND